MAQAADAAMVARIDAAPVIDGRLDDAVWSSLPPIDRFIQAGPDAIDRAHRAAPRARRAHAVHRDPRLRSRPDAHRRAPSATRCRRHRRRRSGHARLRPARPRARLTSESSNVESYSSTRAPAGATRHGRAAPRSQAFDPRARGRDGFRFTVNALGAQCDALVQDGSFSRFDYDALWQSAASADAEGWSAEIALPLAIFAAPAGAAVWGFNAERFIAAASERARLHGAAADKEVDTLADPGAAARRAARPGRQRAATAAIAAAAVAARCAHAAAQRRTRLEPALDVFWQPRPGITGVLTSNTDFAEAEADERRVNLSRFALFFRRSERFSRRMPAASPSAGSTARSPTCWRSARAASASMRRAARARSMPASSSRAAPSSSRAARSARRSSVLTAMAAARGPTRRASAFCAWRGAAARRSGSGSSPREPAARPRGIDTSAESLLLQYHNVTRQLAASLRTRLDAPRARTRSARGARPAERGGRSLQTRATLELVGAFED